MADMDLREVLAEAPCIHPDLGTGVVIPDSCEGAASKHLDCILARLAQPDVPDEFERRLADQLFVSTGASVVTDAGSVLADMLGGES